MEKILSRDNAQIKRLIKLVKSRKERFESGEFVTDGIKLSLEAACNSVEILSVYFTQAAALKYPEKIDEL